MTQPVPRRKQNGGSIPICAGAAARLLAVMFALFLSFSLPAAHAGETAQPQATVTAGRIAGDENSTRVFFDLDRKVEFSTFYMARPDRVVIDAPALLFRFAEADALIPRGLVSFRQYGAITRERSRMVLSLAHPAKVAAMNLEEVEQGRKYRLVIDLARVTRQEFDATLAKQRELVGTSGAVVTKGDRVRRQPAARQEGRFTVVVDPGHGGIDSGAVGKNGTEEKTLTLALAKLVKTAVAAAGPYDVLLTREEDVFMSLRDRVAFFRRNGADLVISIHADSLRYADFRGASIYTLSETASDQIAHELAESENMADIVGGVDASPDDEEVPGILAEFTSRETDRFSLTFSSALVTELGKGIQLVRNPQRHASFAVLKAPEVPGVLLELGYLSNEEDEKLLLDPQWQHTTASLVARAVHN
ncbi:MAG: N-acetylmuramoyl-L-alanine amidase, partial [Nitratireductor sp.]|nr:N-acetylmuramoyl-L-alanine amidase [Nitratireductor sp.]